MTGSGAGHQRGGGWGSFLHSIEMALYRASPSAMQEAHQVRNIKKAANCLAKEGELFGNWEGKERRTEMLGLCW